MHLTLCEVTDASNLGVETMSPFCLKVHRALRLAGLPYERRLASMPSSHKAYNRTGQVPVLLADDQVIPDSTEILRWLASRGHLEAPPEAWLWEELGDSALGGFLIASRWADDDNWPRTRAQIFGGMPAPLRLFLPALIRRRVVQSLVARDLWRAGPDACWRRLEGLLDALDARAPRPGQGWLGGGYTVADLGLFGPIRSLCTPLTPRQEAMVRARPRLVGWMAAIDAATQGQRIQRVA